MRISKRGIVQYGNGIQNAFTEMVNQGTASPLTVARGDISSANAGTSYALFAGGTGNDGVNNATVDAYDPTLVRSAVTSLQIGRNSMAGASVGIYAIFAGGRTYTDPSGWASSNVVTAYNTTLTRSAPTTLPTARYDMASASIGSYAVFASGVGSETNGVVAYNTSLTRSLPTALTNPKTGGVAGISNGTNALFGGGFWTLSDTTVDVYNSSLTRLTPINLSSPRYSPVTALAGDYMLFAGGHTSGNVTTDIVDAFNSSLVRTIATNLSNAVEDFTSTSVHGYALFAGFVVGSKIKTVEIYTPTLSRGLSEITTGRNVLCGGSIGDYALFAGGYGTTNMETIVDVFKYIAQ